jgi:hypothetical protein
MGHWRPMGPMLASSCPSTVSIDVEIMAAAAKLWGGRERLSTVRGRIVSVLAVLFGTVMVLGSSDVGGMILAVILISPLLWWLAWWPTGLNTWNVLIEGRPPQIAVGRSWQSSTSVRKQLRRDNNARIVRDRGGILLRERIWFIASGTPPIRLTASQFERKARFQDNDPVPVGAHRDRRFWWYRPVARGKRSADPR